MTTTSDPVHSRTRMRPEDRKTLIKSIARDVFAQRSYATSGLAEIAERGKISKTLLYHYFPDGRPGVMVAVMDDLDHELDAVTSAALAGHNDIAGRIAAYVEAMLTYFSREPDAFHLLYRDPWGSGEPMVIRRAGGARRNLSRSLSAVITPVETARPQLLAVTTGVIGMLLAVTELMISGGIFLPDAVDTVTRMIIGGLSGLARTDLLTTSAG